MSQHFVTVCVVCVLCAAHTPCWAHKHQDDTNVQSSIEVLERLGQVSPVRENERLLRSKRHVDSEEKYYLKKIFRKYGNGTSLTMDGFETMLKKLGLTDLITNLEREESTNDRLKGPSASLTNSSTTVTDPNSINPTQKCLKKEQLLEKVSEENYELSTKNGTIMPGWLFERMCPVLLYYLSSDISSERNGCINFPESYKDITNKLHEEEEGNSQNMFQVWLYSIISIVIISLCGLLGVAVIPVMGKSYYNQLLQFLVALAIGTLCGDALIHLLPHAMMAEYSHELGTMSEEYEESLHQKNMWKGLIAMMGLIMFFFTEKALAMIAEWRKHQQRKNIMPLRVRVMRETEGLKTNAVGEKLCKHKYSSYPYCYGEITTETRDNHHDHQHNDRERPLAIEEAKPLNDNCNSLAKIMKDDLEAKTVEDMTNHKNGGGGERTENSLNETESYTVIIREHENKHHGHTHSHGHVHAAPESMSSVAWMVIMGDGLHNFTDGMAIGAAFAANIAGGFSTAIAVFCHELPHELGDFAVLIKAGMSAKQAVFYNLLSSVLCLFGMIFGVLLGATPQATSWIFSAAAGMFIYIALVDMIPELSSGHSEEGGSKWQCVLQALGLLTGLGIMLIIAMYEHDLKHIFSK